MPNTLGHFGVQSLPSRALFRDVDVRWILLGCLLPDIPWILKRMVSGVDPRTEMLYFSAQSSLLMTLLLCAAVAFLTLRPALHFGVFTLNALLHFGLDALQTKWGNGVALLAPFSWNLTCVGWFWPEDGPSHVLTALGVVTVAYVWRRGLWSPMRLHGRWWIPAAALLVVYFLAPYAMIESAYESNLRDARTLAEHRTGHAVAFDRGVYDGTFRSWNEVPYRLVPEPAQVDIVFSLRGTLQPDRTIAVTEIHVHAGRYRDFASLAAIVLLAAAFATGVIRSARRSRAAGARSGTDRSPTS